MLCLLWCRWRCLDNYEFKYKLRWTEITLKTRKELDEFLDVSLASFVDLLCALLIAVLVADGVG